jgi:hypothetical protein
MRTQRWTMLEKQMKGSNFMVKHEGVVSRKTTQREKAEFKNLKDYVLKQKKFGEIQVSKHFYTTTNFLIFKLKDTKSTEAGWLRN